VRRLTAGAACVLAAMVAGAVLSRPAHEVGPCTVVEGPVPLAEIPEASGLAVSRRHPGLLWSHNDSGNEPVLFAVDASGSVRGRVRVPAATRDWEDISAARCPSADCLYIADIGDNSYARQRVQIYRVPEPALDDPVTARPEVFSLAYPDGPHNAEAAFVVGAGLFVITRDRAGSLYRVQSLDRGTSDLALERIGELDLTGVTDAEASQDGNTVVVRTSDDVVFYRTADVVRGGTVPRGRRIPVGPLQEPQGEGVAPGADGMLYLASEGRPWSRAGSLITLRCART
jgi:hypothetical protein